MDNKTTDDDDWVIEEIAELKRLLDAGMGARLIAKKMRRNQKSIKQKAKDLQIGSAASGGNYVFSHYLFTSRKGFPPAPWSWEIRRKSKPNEHFLSEKGFRSAKAANWREYTELAFTDRCRRRGGDGGTRFLVCSNVDSNRGVASRNIRDKENENGRRHREKAAASHERAETGKTPQSRRHRVADLMSISSGRASD